MALYKADIKPNWHRKLHYAMWKDKSWEEIRKYVYYERRNENAV